jgi:hypothetical protein
MSFGSAADAMEMRNGRLAARRFAPPTGEERCFFEERRRDSMWIKGVRIAVRWIEQFLAVRLPADALHGLHRH